MDISIVITTYNYEQYILESVRSCLNQLQTNLKYEIIIVNDGSTDQTIDLLKQLSSCNVRIANIDNSGIEVASNYGFKMAQGDFIVRVDADDKLRSNYLSTIEKYLNKTTDFYYGDYLLIDAGGQLIKEVQLPEFDLTEISQRGDFLATGTLYSRKLIESLGGYNTEIMNSGLENYEFILSAINQGYKGLHIAKPIFAYRRHGANISVIKEEKIIENGRRLMQSLGFEKFQTNQYHPYDLKVNE